MNIQEFSQLLLAHMGIEESKVEIDDGDEKFTQVQIAVSEEDSGLLIGYHGESLAAIQKALQLVYGHEEGSKRIVVNVNDYKERRKLQLQEMTQRIAERVLESEQPYTFSYLEASERLIVHETITNDEVFKTLESVSEGEGFQRRLQIRLRSIKPQT